ncbi:sialin-like [Daphnia magna]|uniref:sialin-like n=1 Tax=Daphnia magna TaxID=35525 RepID=UPI001E1BCA19|nr:sialin-like [Daphnia magna]
MKSKEVDGELRVIAPRLLLSCRLTISLTCLFTSFAAILMTINLSMAIVCMNKRSKQLNRTDEINSTNSSSGYFGLNSTCSDDLTTVQEKEMYLDKPAQGMLLGAVYYGVVAVQLLVGWLCDKFGKYKLQMALGSSVLAIASFASPVILENAGVPYYFALRIVKGVAMSFALHSTLPLLTRWTTTQEQGLLMGIASAGIGLANSVTHPISGLLCQHGGWKAIFYFGGACGMVASFLIVCLVYDGPAKHPRVDAEEKQYLLTFQFQSQTSKKRRVIPWAKILCSVPVWSVVVTNFFFFAVVKGIVLNLPIFVRDVLDFTVTENGIFSAMPLIAALLLHLLIGPFFDYIRNHNKYTPTTVRKIFHVVGTLMPGALMFVSSQLSSEYKYFIISLITISYSLTEFAVMGGFGYAMIDLAPDYIGILQGINKTISLAPGFITPLIVSALTPHGSSEEWKHVFILFGALYVLSCLVFVTCGSAQQQSWGKAIKKDTVSVLSGSSKPRNNFA